MIDWSISGGMHFIKKAIINDFDLDFLDLLSLGCPYTYYQTMSKEVEVFKHFIEKNKTYLLAFQEQCSIELDKSKHEFAHNHNLHPFFGFSRGTKYVLELKKTFFHLGSLR